MSLIYLKEASNKKVLNLIRLHEHISGAELSRLTGLGRSMLVYILRALQEQGLIEKYGIGESTSKGGKKPTLWRLNPLVGTIIGAEVLKDQLRFVCVSFDGNIISKETFPLEFNVDTDLCEIIESKYFQFLSNQRLTEKNILAFSIAISGLVDSEKGSLLYSTTLNVNDIELCSVLNSKLNTEVFIINDANAGALSVKWFPGSIEEHNSSIVYLTYNKSSKNIGSGIIIENKLYEGASKTAGEILFPLPSLDNLMNEGIKKAGSDHHIYELFNKNPKLSLEEIFEESKKECPLSSVILDNISEFIANEIVRIIGFLNPELIVIGGEIAFDEEILSNFIIPKVDKIIDQTLNKRVLIPRIKFSKHKDYSVAMGAIAKVYSEILSV